MSFGGGGGGESREARELYKTQAEIARGQWDLFKSHGLPQLTRLSEEVDAYASPGRVAEAEGAAASDVSASYDRARAGFRSELGRYGMRPGSGRFVSGLRALALGEAADKAGARTTARRGILDRALSNRFGLASVWQGQAGQAVQGLGAAARGLAGIAGQKRQQRGSMMQALGSIAGSAAGAFILASDRRLKRNIRPIARLPNGLKVYDHTYLDDADTHYASLMGDEVLDVWPEFVQPVSGYLFIAYFPLIAKVMDDAN